MTADTKNIWDVALTIVALIGGFIAFVKTIAEWRESQRWKRSEHLNKLIESFEADALIKVACVALDWTNRKITHDKRDVVLSNRDVLLGLRDHTKYTDLSFDGEQPLVRDAMDALFFFLARLGLALETGLVDVAPTRTYFRYWMIRLATMDVHPVPQGDQAFADLEEKTGAELVARYIATYGDADDFRRLCERLEVEFPELNKLAQGASGGARQAVVPT